MLKKKEKERKVKWWDLCEFSLE